MKLFLILFLFLITPLFVSGTEVTPQHGITQITYSYHQLLNENNLDQPLLARSGGRAGGRSFSHRSSSGGGGGSYGGSYGSSNTHRYDTGYDGDYTNEDVKKSLSCDWNGSDIRFLVIFIVLVLSIFVFTGSSKSDETGKS